MQLVNIGFGNIVSASRIVAIVSPESAPIKRLIQEAKDNKTAVDATYGRRWWWLPSFQRSTFPV